MKSFNDSGLSSFFIKALALAFAIGGLYYHLRSNTRDIHAIEKVNQSQEEEINENTRKLSQNNVKWDNLNKRLDRIDERQKDIQNSLKEMIKERDK